MEINIDKLPYKSTIEINGLEYRFDGIEKVSYQKIESYIFTCLDDRHEYKGHKQTYPIYTFRQRKIKFENNKYILK